MADLEGKKYDFQTVVLIKSEILGIFKFVAINFYWDL